MPRKTRCSHRHFSADTKTRIFGTTRAAAGLQYHHLLNQLALLHRRTVLDPFLMHSRWCRSRRTGDCDCGEELAADSISLVHDKKCDPAATHPAPPSPARLGCRSTEGRQDETARRNGWLWRLRSRHLWRMPRLSDTAYIRTRGSGRRGGSCWRLLLKSAHQHSSSLIPSTHGLQSQVAPIETLAVEVVRIRGPLRLSSA